jgi:putative N6-adenine-specific DNA methylase
VEVHAAKHKTRLYHTGKVAEVVLRALAGSAGVREAADGEEPLAVHVRIDGPRVAVSLDTSGEHLHRRGYRTEAGPAPLRENLAAGLLMRAGWNGAEPLLDPFCGSGTFPVEAALLALRMAPGLGRAFAFERLPSFRPGAWATLRSEAAERAGRALPAPILASDQDGGALALTARAARRAGLADHVQVARLEVGELTAPAPGGLVATNPPYGVRLAGAAAALGGLGRALRGPLRAWRWAAILPAGSGAAEGRLGLPIRERFLFRSGGLRLQWSQGGPASAAEVSG